MTPAITRRAAVLTGAALLGTPAILRAQTALPRVKYQVDWAFQGPNAYMLLGRDKGFFRDAGVDITVDRGFGSGRVPVDVAGGAYEMAQADINPVIKFVAQNPNAGLLVIGIFGDRSLLCTTVRADSAIRVPKDLEGKTLAAPESDAGRQIFPAFAVAAGIDASKINWLTVQPELRETMLVQRRADGITGAATSTALSLKALGMDLPAQRIMYYRDYGLDLYGSCYVTTKAYAQRNPDLVRAVLRGAFRSLIYAQRNPAEAIAALRATEPLTDVAIETERQAVSIDEMIRSENVLRNGLSVVDPARLGRGLAAVAQAYGLPNTVKPEDMYTDAYLPPISERMLSGGI
ncbi:NitT/TauT family transport system substrate-binding protein [Humitalea rosea]|uniref:Thiamine pyrimidine synthase n=1 Tax=Humitalea rosea TaxID=990373 RepID=A0A2W7I7V4_9PROT|nr:ABC transporter substrate-binding protein [Humitalea rosea]PZW42976.1 NitT/TauT family transport system substrate-binding protein [Humitalea rosea]